MAGVFGQSIYASSGGTVAGLCLLPFSAHHALALMEIDSPYVNGGAVSLWDTTAALIVCRTRRAGGMRAVTRSAFSVIHKGLWLLWWVRHNHARVSDDLGSYITASIRSPEMWIDSDAGQGKRTGAPWPYYLVSVIAQEMPSIPYADLWDMPLSELACHKAIIDERTGGAEIAERQMDELKKRKARRKDG